MLCMQDPSGISSSVDAEADRTASTCRIMADVFAVITAVPSVDAADAETIAMETLFDAHHPAIGMSYK